MSLTFEFTMAPRLGLEVSPALIAFGELLMLPYAALQAVIDDELRTNADLERLEPGDCPVCRGSWRSRCPVCAVPAHRSAGPDHRDVCADLPAAESDCQALRRAVRAETSSTDAAAVDYLIDSLDHHGLLDRSYADLAADLGIAEQEVVRLVEVIRRCGPPGIGATGAGECLLLQLEALHLPDDQARLARAVIADHLPALARGHFAAIADLLGTSREQVRGVLDLIRRRLRPYPAFDGNNTAAPAYVVPDLVIRADPRRPGGFVVELVEAATTRLRVRRRRVRRVAGPIVPGPAARPLGDAAPDRRVRRRPAAGVPGRRRCGPAPADPCRGRRGAGSARVHGEPRGGGQVRPAARSEPGRPVQVLRVER